MGIDRRSFISLVAGGVAGFFIGAAKVKKDWKIFD